MIITQLNKNIAKKLQTLGYLCFNLGAKYQLSMYLLYCGEVGHLQSDGHVFSCDIFQKFICF